MSISVKLSELCFIELPSTEEIHLYSNNLATELLQKHGASEVKDIVRFSSVIRVQKNLLAYENFFLLQALQRLKPDFEVELTAQKEKTFERATHRIVRYVAITSITSFDAMQVSSFEKKSKELLSYISLFRRAEWRQIIRCDRTSFNHHDKKFTAAPRSAEEWEISLDEALAHIPPTGDSDNE